MPFPPYICSLNLTIAPANIEVWQNYDNFYTLLGSFGWCLAPSKTSQAPSKKLPTTTNTKKPDTEYPAFLLESIA